MCAFQAKVRRQKLWKVNWIQFSIRYIRVLCCFLWKIDLVSIGSSRTKTKLFWGQLGWIFSFFLFLFFLLCVFVSCQNEWLCRLGLSCIRMSNRNVGLVANQPWNIAEGTSEWKHFCDCYNQHNSTWGGSLCKYFGRVHVYRDWKRGRAAETKGACEKYHLRT